MCNEIRLVSARLVLMGFQAIFVTLQIVFFHHPAQVPKTFSGHSKTLTEINKEVVSDQDQQNPLWMGNVRSKSPPTKQIRNESNQNWSLETRVLGKCSTAAGRFQLAQRGALPKHFG